MDQCSSAEREVVWRARLQPFRSAVVYIWTALSFERSSTAGLAVCATALTVLLGATLLDGSVVHQLGILLLMSALCYGLVVAASLQPTRVPDEEQRLKVICHHLARLEELLVAGTVKCCVLRLQHPMWFYAGGLVLVFLLGKLSQWLPVMVVVWAAVAVLLMVPAALSRKWVTVPTPQQVGEVVSQLSSAMQWWLNEQSRRTPVRDRRNR